jgi:tRNA(Phe) wybutosine-synthesizing methylase Tyw3
LGEIRTEANQREKLRVAQAKKRKEVDKDVFDELKNTLVVRQPTRKGEDLRRLEEELAKEEEDRAKRLEARRRRREAIEKGVEN